MTIEAVTAAPKVKLPSTVKSGKSIILKVINTAIAATAYISPISKTPINCKLLIVILDLISQYF
jgi:hypothetical protein